MAMEQRSQSLMETYNIVSDGVEARNLNGTSITMLNTFWSTVGYPNSTANQTSGPLWNQTGRMWKRPATETQYKKGPWNSEEDSILLNYITTHGEGSWSKIPKRTNLLRSGKSCRLRWKNQLRPEVIKTPLTPEEEEIIAHLQSQFGNRWSIISAYLPGRTDNDVKNFWNSRDSKRRQRRRCSVAPPLPPLSQPVFEGREIHDGTASSVGVPILKDISWYIPQTLENSYFPPQLQNMHVGDHRQFAGLYPPTNHLHETLRLPTPEFWAQPVFPVESTFDPFVNDIIPSMASTSSGVVGTDFPDFGISMAVTDLSPMPSSSNLYNMCQIAGGGFAIPPSINAAGTGSSFNADQSNADAFPGRNGEVDLQIMTESGSNRLADADKDDLDIDLILSNVDLDEFSELLDELDVGVPVDGSIENIDAAMTN